MVVYIMFLYTPLEYQSKTSLMLLLALVYAKAIFKASCKKQYMRLNYQVLREDYVCSSNTTVE